MSEKPFFEPTPAQSGLPFILEPEYHTKKLKPLGQYFPLRKCNGKLRIYTENILEHKVNFCGAETCALAHLLSLTEQINSKIDITGPKVMVSVEYTLTHYPEM